MHKQNGTNQILAPWLVDINCLHKIRIMVLFNKMLQKH